MNKRVVRVVSAAIEREGRYLITQRMEKAVLPLLWEFPGGKVEASETDRDALARELHYRLGIKAKVGEEFSTTRRSYDTYDVELHLYRCDIGTSEPQALTVKDLSWVSPQELDRFEFTPADQASMDALLAERQR